MPPSSLYIQRYGITLCRLTSADLEFVRSMRNDPLIRRNMEFQQHITPKMQQQWFKRINNENNWFFVIYHKGEKIGLISTFNLHQIGKGAANAGIFIWQPDLLGTPVPVYAVLALLDFSFFILGLKRTQVKIKSTNKRALAYNKGLGYQLLPDAAKTDAFEIYELTAKRYLKTAAKLRKIAAKIHGNESLLRYQSDLLPQLHHKLQTLFPALKKELNLTVEVIGKSHGGQ